MALITISGFPCSGKSRRAGQIKQYLEKQLQDPTYRGPTLKVVLLSDDSLSLERNVYDTSKSEKPARGALFTAMQRQLGADTILIVDAPNYIKGFRYQMYCAAREHKIRVCTVYVVATHDLCKQWNSSRRDGHAYATETLDNMLMRFEEPSSMARWDAPLFTILWDEPEVPGAAIWEATTTGTVKAPNSGTQNVARAPTDALHTLEQTTAAMVSSIMGAQSQSASPGLGGKETLSVSLPSPSGTTPPMIRPVIVLPAHMLTLSELQRLKRQFVLVHKKAITLGTTERGAVDWTEESVAAKFVTYLEENMKP